MKGHKLMADELELVMDIDTLEIFEVKSSDDNSKNDLGSPEEMVEEQVFNSAPYHTNVVQLTLFDNNFYPHPVMFFEDSS